MNEIITYSNPEIVSSIREERKLPQQTVNAYQQGSDISGDQELIMRFLEEQKPRTREEYKKTLIGFVRFINERLYLEKLHDVGVGSIQDYKYHLQTYTKKNGKNLAAATIAQRLRIVSSLFSFGVKSGYFKINPVSVIKKPQIKNINENKYLTEEEVTLILGQLKNSSKCLIKKQDKEKRAVAASKAAGRKNLKLKKSKTKTMKKSTSPNTTKDKKGQSKNTQSQRNYQAINTRNYLIGLMLFYLGLRVSELCGIRWNDFFVNPKGHIGLTVHQKGGGTRVVKIRPDLWEQIKQYREMENMSTNFSQHDTSPLFLNYKKEALTQWYVRKLIRESCKTLGIEKGVTPHWFRHTSASHALALGADIKSVQAQFGWTNLNTPSRYLHSVRGLDDTATDIMPTIKLS